MIPGKFRARYCNLICVALRVSKTQRLAYGPSRRATLLVHIPYRYFEETQDPNVTFPMLHTKMVRMSREELRFSLAGLFRSWRDVFVFDVSKRLEFSTSNGR
jgi:hypothetical protein